MVEQIDRDAGWNPIDTADMWQVAVVTDGESVAIAQKAECDYGGFYWAVEPDGALEWEPTQWTPWPPESDRATERARILAAMRQPDAAMVEAVAKAIWGDEPGADEYWTAFEDHANRALAAAADHMEAGDAG